MGHTTAIQDYAHNKAGRLGGYDSRCDLISRIDSPSEVKGELRVGDVCRINSLEHECWSNGKVKIYRDCYTGYYTSRGEITIEKIEVTDGDNIAYFEGYNNCIPTSCLTLVKAVDSPDNLAKLDEKEMAGRGSSRAEMDQAEPSKVAPPVQPTFPGYLPSSTGPDMLWPNVKPTTLAENKPLHSSDTAVNSRSKMAALNVRDALTRLNTSASEIGLINNADRRAMLPELVKVQKMSTELIKRIEKSLD